MIYPVVNNWAKYNMGYYIGSKTCSPQRICWKTDGTVSITKIDNEGVGAKNELYLRGTTFYSAGDAAIKNCKETIINSTEKDAWMKMQTGSNNQIYDCPIVKIFNRIWTRKYFRDSNSTIWFHPGAQYFKQIDNWSFAGMGDFEDIKNGLINANIELPGLYMCEIQGGKDLTGFNIEWDLGYYINGKEQTCDMEYLANPDPLTKIMVVHFDKKGGMSFREAKLTTKDEYPARLVQPLRPNIKK